MLTSVNEQRAGAFSSNGALIGCKDKEILSQGKQEGVKWK